ncbi:hypothetical protein NEOLEDRAFT_1126922 [Neolentinus lepideus HHB14362 ss-1]|uniref:Uncharacterized protein n=1 Tax=Neolentinus lepideus HHB14362 ss-1 TaxID=1314782 RepID=A0A165VS06_9AGAM|nr:hypothetical protein NEOLEDRAFT_1126922 [Neolentinus lepideus HHB14362 ss-1]
MFALTYVVVQGIASFSNQFRRPINQTRTYPPNVPSSTTTLLLIALPRLTVSVRLLSDPSLPLILFRAHAGPVTSIPRRLKGQGSKHLGREPEGCDMGIREVESKVDEEFEWEGEDEWLELCLRLSGGGRADGALTERRKCAQDLVQCFDVHRVTN